jgi:acetylornithine deacetylase
MASVRSVSPAVAKLWEMIEQREDELIELVAELVRRPSELGQEGGAQAFVADQLRESGLSTDVWDLDADLLTLPNAGKSGVPFTDRPNVVGSLAGAGGGHSLILNGHIDVVSPEPVSGWTYDPWAATIDGGRMYGRGAHDMKSGIGLNLFLPRLIRDLGIELGGDLIVQSVIEEECTGNGALAASLRYPADAAIVTEPTGGSFTAAHVGVMWFKVAISGKSWHAMEAYKGVNAILKARVIIDTLVALDQRLNEQPVHPAFAGIEHPINLNIGVIQGGDWPSTVPGRCELHCRLCFYPGQSVTDVRAAVEEAVYAATTNDPWLAEHPPVISYDGFQSAGSTVSLDEPMVRLLGTWHEAVVGSPMTPRSGTGINDMRYFNFAGIPAGCYGTSGGNGHAADEWLDLASLVPTAKVLGATILDWCGVVE